MQFTVSFVVRAKAALHAWSVGTSLEGDVLISEAVLWACDTSDRVAWTREEIVEGTKEIFVNHATVAHGGDFAHNNVS